MTVDAASVGPLLLSDSFITIMDVSYLNLLGYARVCTHKPFFFPLICEVLIVASKFTRNAFEITFTCDAKTF